MKRKAIIIKIKEKMNSWLESIDEDILRKEIRDNLIVTGGAITSMLMDTKVNDYDVYIKDREVLRKLILYYMKKYPHRDLALLDGHKRHEYLQSYIDYMSAYEKNSDVLDNEDLDEDIEFKDVESILNTDGDNSKEINEDDIYDGNGFIIAIKNLEKEQLKLFSTEGIYKRDILKIKSKYPDNPELKDVYEPLVFTANAITFTNKIQLVIRFFGKPEEIHENYDFVHVTNYFTFKDGLVLNKSALDSILTKTLYYQGSKYPLTSIIRTRKFIQRGFDISAAEFLKMSWQLSKLDLENPRILEEQLMGVDVAYFSWLISEIRALISKKGKLTTEWLFKLLDKIFYESD